MCRVPSAGLLGGFEVSPLDDDVPFEGCAPNPELSGVSSERCLPGTFVGLHFLPLDDSPGGFGADSAPAVGQLHQLFAVPSQSVRLVNWGLGRCFLRPRPSLGSGGHRLLRSRTRHACPRAAGTNGPSPLPSPGFGYRVWYGLLVALGLVLIRLRRHTDSMRFIFGILYLFSAFALAKAPAVNKAAALMTLSQSLAQAETRADFAKVYSAGCAASQKIFSKAQFVAALKKGYGGMKSKGMKFKAVELGGVFGAEQELVLDNSVNAVADISKLNTAKVTFHRKFWLSKNGQTIESEVALPRTFHYEHQRWCYEIQLN